MEALQVRLYAGAVLELLSCALHSNVARTRSTAVLCAVRAKSFVAP